MRHRKNAICHEQYVARNLKALLAIQLGQSICKPQDTSAPCWVRLTTPSQWSLCASTKIEILFNNLINQIMRSIKRSTHDAFVRCFFAFGGTFLLFSQTHCKKFLLAMAKNKFFKLEGIKNWCNFVAKHDKRRRGECKKRVQLGKRSKSAPREASNLTYPTSHTKTTPKLQLKHNLCRSFPHTSFRRPQWPLRRAFAIYFESLSRRAVKFHVIFMDLIIHLSGSFEVGECWRS